MKVAINTYPLNSAHKTRGIGIYTKNLLSELKKIDDLEIVEFIGSLQENDIDLVHYPWFDLFYRSLPLRKKIPTVVTIHDVSPLIFPEVYQLGVRAKINLFLQKVSLQSCKAIITDSQNSKKDIVKFLKINKEKISVVPLAADSLFKELSDSEKLKIKMKFHLPDKFLLYVGDANFVKNLPFLIDGFKELKNEEEFSNLKLVLVGEVFLKKPVGNVHTELKSLSDTLEKIKDLNLQNEIITPGHMDILDLVGLYNLATAYIQPSFYEGFGIPVLEALSCGTPVICSSAASLPEVSGEAAVYFDPTDLKQFIKVTSDVLKDGSFRKKLSRLGINRAKLFSWEKTAKFTYNIYKNVKE